MKFLFVQIPDVSNQFDILEINCSLLPLLNV